MRPEIAADQPEKEVKKAPAADAGNVGAKASKPLPRILGGICEFCGDKAVRCQHSAQFKAAGFFNRGESAKELAKIYQDFPGLPRVINKICEFCGVDAADSENCKHYKDRSKIAFTAKSAPVKAVQTEDGVEIEETKLSGDEKIEVEPSGDDEMDAMMDEDEQEDEFTDVE